MSRFFLQSLKKKSTCFACLWYMYLQTKKTKQLTLTKYTSGALSHTAILQYVHTYVQNLVTRLTQSWWNFVSSFHSLHIIQQIGPLGLRDECFSQTIWPWCYNMNKRWTTWSGGKKSKKETARVIFDRSDPSFFFTFKTRSTPFLQVCTSKCNCRQQQMAQLTVLKWNLKPPKVVHPWFLTPYQQKNVQNLLEDTQQAPERFSCPFRQKKKENTSWFAWWLISPPPPTLA